WPYHESQEEIPANIGDSTGFGRCVGFLNGSLLPVEKIELIGPQYYYSSKGSYGLEKFIDSCDINQQKGKFSSPGRYIIGDSGFPIKVNLVPEFKNPLQGSMPQLKKKKPASCGTVDNKKGTRKEWEIRSSEFSTILEGCFQLLQALKSELSSIQKMKSITE
ncbi:hypothetical protein VP01_1289g2, partial [Puccinia sorghi]